MVLFPYEMVANAGFEVMSRMFTNPLVSAGKVLGKDKVVSCIPVEVRSSLGTHTPET